MIIKRLDYKIIESWRDEIVDSLNASAAVNFPSMQVDEKYGMQRYEELIGHLKNNKAVIFGALEGDVLAGWIWCHEIDRMERKRLHIAEITVKREFRRQGIGKKLLEEAEKYGKDRGYREADLLVTGSNEDAVRFYKDLGFDIERYQMIRNLI